jgi:hypothetical protein
MWTLSSHVLKSERDRISAIQMFYRQIILRIKTNILVITALRLLILKQFKELFFLQLLNFYECGNCRWIFTIHLHLTPEFKYAKNYLFVGFEVFTAVVMKSIIFWDMTEYTASYPRR